MKSIPRTGMTGEERLTVGEANRITFADEGYFAALHGRDDRAQADSRQLVFTCDAEKTAGEVVISFWRMPAMLPA